MNRFIKWLAVGSAMTAIATGGAGCLSRPVGQQPPTTKVNFTSTVSQQAVDKVDLLFMIDNSASMGDKQEILAEAVPNLIEGLLKPICVDPDGNPIAGSPTPTADPGGNKDNNYGCPQGSEPEFKPVSDMHIGIVSSSLGNFGAGASVVTPNPKDAVCDPASNGRLNDRAHLLNLKKGDPAGVPEAKPSNFLAWYPSNKENEDKNRHPTPPVAAIGDIAQLSTAFQDLVVGTEQNGCGLEAQLESFYRFLIQPDPWVNITLDKFNQADLGTDVDVELLQQRADFLRPDSLVAIIMLTDEDDSSSDPLAVGGQGWAFMARNFPGSKVLRGAENQGTTAPRGTTACSKDPGSPDCTSCGFQTLCNPADAACQKIKNDENCKALGSPPRGSDGPEGYAGYYGPEDDNLNVRFHRMKERFGIDPQYPVERYVDGLTKFKVPDRKAEHPTTVQADGRRSIAGYTNTAKCTNPLFAAKLPRNPGDELCNLPRSTRSPDLIFFAVVGGVPNELLHFKPGDPEGSRINNDDWVKILGRDPARFNFDGIDPHMIQSVAPRPNLEGPSATRGDNGSDPIHGREWDTRKSDLQYACTFPLGDKTRTCPGSDPSCDCGRDGENPPLCEGPITGGNGTQVRAKAYPTVREFRVVRALGDQGVIASLCPIQLTDKNAPTYGYKPAVAAIIDRLKNALTTQCLPQKLTRDAANEVPCRVLAQLAEPTDDCGRFGLQPPPPEVLKVFLEQQREESGNVGGDGGLDLSKLPVCDVPQEIVPPGGTCRDITDIKWCYVENVEGQKPVAGRCPQALIFSTGTAQLVGARFSLQCIQQFGAGQAAGDQPQQQQ